MKTLFNLFLTLRGRLIFLSCLATFPAMLFIFYLAEKERSFTFQNMEEEAEHLATLAAREHSYQFGGAQTLLKWMGEKLLENRAISQFRFDEGFLTTLLVGHPHLANIGVLSKDGDVISSAYPLSNFPNLSDNPAVKRALNSKEIEAGSYVISPIVGRPVLNLAYAVRDPGGTIYRIVFSGIDLQWLTKLAKQVDIPKDYILLIVDRDGRILTHSGFQDEGIFKMGEKISELSNLSMHGSGKIIKLVDSKKKFFLLLKPMPGVPGVFVVSGLPYDRIYEKVNRTFFRILG
ncbi:cache domain-containing protein, partial [bacterium]|nr:cache domain-containing protein [bacterium]